MDPDRAENRFAAASVAELSTWVARGDVSSIEIVGAALDLAERLQPDINAFITIDRAGATAAAAVADAEIRRGAYRGALHGIPVAVKDVFWTRGLRTTAGSRIMASFVADRDAAVVERLRSGGAVIVGKTNLPEFAYSPCDQYHSEFGSVRNPWDLARFPGASSNGSAAAVAARVVPLALGTDTGGSVRTPASFCGISGFKPTYGLISVRGMMPLAPSMDHVGLLARSAEDCATLTTALAGYDRSDRLSAIEADSATPLRPLSANLNGVRVGVADSFFSDDVDASVASAVHAAVETLLRHGAVARPVSLSGIMEDVTHALAILKVEASYVHDRDLAEHADDLVGDVRVKLQEGSRISGVEYLHALDARSRVRKRLAEAFDDIDVLVGPTCDTTAPLMADDGRVLEPAPYLVAGRPSARIPFNLTGNPAISVPCGYDELGLPVGLQIVGRPWNDWMALSVAHAFQSITDWHLQAPPLSNPARAHLSAALSESVDPTSSDAF